MTLVDYIVAGTFVVIILLAFVRMRPRSKSWPRAAGSGG